MAAEIYLQHAASVNYSSNSGSFFGSMTADNHCDAADLDTSKISFDYEALYSTVSGNSGTSDSTAREIGNSTSDVLLGQPITDSEDG